MSGAHVGGHVPRSPEVRGRRVWGLHSLKPFFSDLVDRSSSLSLFIITFDFKIIKITEAQASRTQLPLVMLLAMAAGCWQSQGTEDRGLRTSPFRGECVICVQAALAASATTLLAIPPVRRGTRATTPDPRPHPGHQNAVPRLPSSRRKLPKRRPFVGLHRGFCFHREQLTSPLPTPPPPPHPAPGRSSPSLPPPLRAETGSGEWHSHHQREGAGSNSGLAGWPLASVPAAGSPCPGSPAAKTDWPDEPRLCEMTRVLFGARMTGGTWHGITQGSQACVSPASSLGPPLSLVSGREGAVSCQPPPCQAGVITHRPLGLVGTRGHYPLVLQTKR